MKSDAKAAQAVIELDDIGDLPAAAKRALQAAVRALKLGDLGTAERELTVTLVYAPAHAEPHRLLGITLQRRGRPAHAIASFREALAARPGDRDILLRLVQAHAEANDLAAAIAVAQDLVSAHPAAEELYLLGGLLDRHGEIEEALAVAQRALNADPNHAKARVLLAHCQFHSGRVQEAETQFRQLLRSRQEVAAAWHGLAELRTVRFDAEDLAALRLECAKPKSGELERATLQHVLGRALEDAGDYPAAFAAFSESAQRQRAKFPWDAGAFARHTASLRDAFATPVAAPADFGSEVIFIVGMPRSGSTLIEQILAAHPQVEGASELPDLQAVIQQESARRQAPLAQWATRATPADWRRLGEIYLERTQRWRDDKPRFTDKMPGNWQLAEAALAMLPGARVIDCRRDALETCWSCFKQFFAPGLVPWSCSFDDLAAYWRECERHGDQLAARYPRSFRILRYEELIDDPEARIRALLTFCGLEFDAACLSPHEVNRTIRTASAAQVRQPLRRQASNVERYGALLNLLRGALAAR